MQDLDRCFLFINRKVHLRSTRYMESSVDSTRQRYFSSLSCSISAARFCSLSKVLTSITCLRRAADSSISCSLVLSSSLMLNHRPNQESFSIIPLHISLIIPDFRDFSKEPRLEK